MIDVISWMLTTAGYALIGAAALAILYEMY